MSANEIFSSHFEAGDLGQFFAGVDACLESGRSRNSSALEIPALAAGKLEEFFHCIDEQLHKQRQLDRCLASKFNVFDLIDPDENKLSDILQILLDPQGVHGQGDLFLRLFIQQIQQLKIGSDAARTEDARVHREALTHSIEKNRRRIDILVDAGVLVAIENKVDAWEQENQIRHYLEHLQLCARRTGKQAVLIYLTPNGRLPGSLSRELCDEATASQRFCCWSYQGELREWLSGCREKCAAPRFTSFLNDFLGYIEEHLKRDPENEAEDESNEE